MSQSTCSVKQSQVAVVAWGFKEKLEEVASEEVCELIDQLSKKYAGVDIWEVRRREWVADFRKNIIAHCRSAGIQKVYFVVEKFGDEFEIVIGDLCIAGIESNIVEMERCMHKPRPMTIRTQEVYRKVRPEWRKDLKGNPEVVGEKEIGVTPIQGEWQKIEAKGIVIHRWQEKRWSYEELAATEMPFGSVIMWKPSDYDELSKEEGSPPLSPPEWLGYPHTLELKGLKMSQVPLRYLDYLVGKSWIYGEFAQKLRQWLGQPTIQEELKRFESREYESNLKSDSTGYWNEKDQYVYTGCQGGKAQKEVPVWLTPRDRFGNELKGRSKYNETMMDRAAKIMEQLGYEDLRDDPPHTWVFGAPWLFESVDQDEEVEERNLDERYEVLNEEGQEKDPSRDRWCYSSYELWKRMGSPKDDKDDPRVKDYLEAEKRAERNAWYKYEEILDGLDRLEAKAKTAESRADWNQEEKSLLEEGRDLLIQATPLLREIIGAEAFAWLRKRAAEVKKEVQEAAKRCQNAKLAAIAEVVREHPETLPLLIRTNLELALEMMEVYPEFQEKKSKEEVRIAKRLMALKYPELYTKKGRRRKKPIYG